MEVIKLNKGKETLVDNGDYEILNRFHWSYHYKGYAYRCEWVDGKQESIFMHRQIMGYPKDKAIDHIDRNGLNNQKSNLRLASRKQNQANHGLHRNNKSGYMGVFWNKGWGAWVATIHNVGRTIVIGPFQQKKHAALARDLWVKDMRGEYANLNFKSI